MEHLGRDEYKYIEGDHALTLQVEMLSRYPKQSDILTNNQKFNAIG